MHISKSSKNCFQIFNLGQTYLIGPKPPLSTVYTYTYSQGRTGSNIRPGKILLNRPTLLKTDLFFIQNSIMLGADTKNLHIFDRSTVFTWYRQWRSQGGASRGQAPVSAPEAPVVAPIVGPTTSLVPQVCPG